MGFRSVGKLESGRRAGFAWVEKPTWSRSCSGICRYHGVETWSFCASGDDKLSISLFETANHHNHYTIWEMSEIYVLEASKNTKPLVFDTSKPICF